MSTHLAAALCLFALSADGASLLAVASTAGMGRALVSCSIGLAMLLITFNNITDYGTNFALVQHVLSMDDITLPGITTHWRGIHSRAVHHVGYDGAHEAKVADAHAAVDF